MQYRILNTFAFKNFGKFANHNLEKFCPWFLALAPTISVTGLKKVGLWPWPRIFFETLALASNVASSIPSLLNGLAERERFRQLSPGCATVLSATKFLHLSIMQLRDMLKTMRT